VTYSLNKFLFFTSGDARRPYLPLNNRGDREVKSPPAGSPNSNLYAWKALKDAKFIYLLSLSKDYVI
jgi:hypothetical protein